jgi:hypothetical protein
MADSSLTDVGLTGAPGHVIQTVHQASYQGNLSSTGVTAMTATPNICAITPKSSGSKILVMVDQPFSANKGTTHTDQGLAYEIWRSIGGGSYSVRKNFSSTGTNIRVYLLDNDSSVASSISGSLSYSYLDSPATTSACSYRMYMGQWSARNNIESNSWENMTTWVLQEIAQ